MGRGKVVELECLNNNVLKNTYALSCVKEEFQKAVNEKWRQSPPWERYQKKLIGNLAILEDYKEQAITLVQFEKLTGVDNLYSIRYPKAKKNIRVIYTIYGDSIILLKAFLEKSDSDYQRAIKISKERLKQLIND